MEINVCCALVALLYTQCRAIARFAKFQRYQCAGLPVALNEHRENQMSKSISNTLTRWHKIAERIKVAGNELMQKNLQTLQVGRALDEDTFTVRKASLHAAATLAVEDQTTLYFALQGALHAIRRALAHANANHGVSDLLSQMEETRQKTAYYTALTDTAEGALSQEEFTRLCAKKNASSSGRYGTSVTFLSEDTLAKLSDKRDAARREMNALADQLSDANATKLTLTIEDTVVRVIGL